MPHLAAYGISGRVRSHLDLLKATMQVTVAFACVYMWHNGCLPKDFIPIEYVTQLKRLLHPTNNGAAYSHCEVSDIHHYTFPLSLLLTVTFWVISDTFDINSGEGRKEPKRKMFQGTWSFVIFTRQTPKGIEFLENTPPTFNVSFGNHNSFPPYE